MPNNIRRNGNVSQTWDAHAELMTKTYMSVCVALNDMARLTLLADQAGEDTFALPRIATKLADVIVLMNDYDGENREDVLMRFYKSAAK